MVRDSQTVNFELYNLTILNSLMPEFDFKRYHIRSINATSEEERAAINLELKELYASLSEEDKKDFNIQLEKFMIVEMGRLSNDYEAIKGLNNPN